MTEKRFKSNIDEETMSIMPYLVSDNKEEAFYNLQGCVDLLNEQQATISRLKKENEQLREINKEIGDDLHNCRINKNIIREKLKLWQDAHKEYDIYSIKDFEELMKNDK